MSDRQFDKHSAAVAAVAKIRKALVGHIATGHPLAREMQHWRNDLCDVEDVLRSTPSADQCRAEPVEVPGIGAMKWCEPCGLYFGKDQPCPSARSHALRSEPLFSDEQRKALNNLAERLRNAMNFIEEWANWWSYALDKMDVEAATAEDDARATAEAASLGERARKMVIDNRRALADVPALARSATGGSNG